MAKEKTNKKDTPTFINTLNKKYKKEYGEIICSGMQVLESRKNHKMLSVSPSLDFSLGGGIKEGTLTLISGDEGSGKTTLALHLASKHQGDESYVQPNGDKGRPVLYINSEARLDEKHFSGIQGLDPEKMWVMQKEKDGPPLPAQVFLNAAIDFMSDPNNKGAMVIVDSTSTMVTQEELDEQIKAGRTVLPRLLSLFCKKFCQIIPDQDITLIIITHLIANTGAMGNAPKKVPDCGRKIRYAADTILEVAYIQKWTDGKDDVNHIGQKIHWKIHKSSMASTAKKAESWLRYGIGMDEVKEAVEIGLEFGFVENAGAWYYPYGKEEGTKCQGLEKFLTWIDENKDYVDYLYNKIREVS